MEINGILDVVKKNIDKFLVDHKNGVIVIWGATATGKSGLSVLLSGEYPIEVISADSRQIYKYMDIGTDKISKEIRAKIPHHQIDIVAPDELYSAGAWQKDTEILIDQIRSRGNIPFVVGGTGLYIDTIYKNFVMPSVQADFDLRKRLEEEEFSNPGILFKRLEEIDPMEASRINRGSYRFAIRALEIFMKTGKRKSELVTQSDPKRPMFMLGLRREKEDTNMRINKRIKEMVQSGLVDEVRGLLEMGYSRELQSMTGIGYREVVGHIDGNYDLEKTMEHLRRNTHHYAKRQRTWFRRYMVDKQSAPRKNVLYKVFNLTGEGGFSN